MNTMKYNGQDNKAMTVGEFLNSLIYKIGIVRYDFTFVSETGTIRRVDNILDSIKECKIIKIIVDERYNKETTKGMMYIIHKSLTFLDLRYSSIMGYISDGINLYVIDDKQHNYRPVLSDENWDDYNNYEIYDICADMFGDECICVVVKEIKTNDIDNQIINKLTTGLSVLVSEIKDGFITIIEDEIPIAKKVTARDICALMPNGCEAFITDAVFVGENIKDTLLTYNPELKGYTLPKYSEDKNYFLTVDEFNNSTVTNISGGEFDDFVPSISIIPPDEWFKKFMF